jgi:hypothetical protein
MSHKTISHFCHFNVLTVDAISITPAISIVPIIFADKTRHEHYYIIDYIYN